MAWIESHQELRDHPKVIKTARLLTINKYQVIGHLQCLWWWALNYAEDGTLDDYDDATIADAAGWDGDASAFVTALITCGPGSKRGFIERDTAGQRLHDWPEYSGKLIDARRRNAEKQREWRDRHRDNPAPVTDQAVVRNRDITVTLPSRNGATGPNPTGPDMTGPEIVSSAEETAPSGAASLRSALDQAKHDLEQPKANKAGIVGRVFENVYGRKPAFGFLAALIRDYDAPYELCCLMVEILPDWNGCDDPQKFLAGVISTRKDKRRANGRSPPTNPYLTAEQLAEKARLDQEQLAEFVAQDQAKWKH